MAISNDYPVVDGIACSWADIVVKGKPQDAPLIDMKWIQAINTGATVEIGTAKAASGGRVMKRTTGSVDYEASITFYREGYQIFLRNLLAIAPVRGNQRIISLAPMSLIEVQHTPLASEEIYIYRLKGCRVAGETMNHAEGTDAEVVEVPLSVLEKANVVDGVECVML